MVRHIFAIPLAVVVAIAVFLCPVMGADTPSVNPSYMITVQTRSGSNLGSPEIFTGGLGSITSLAFKNDLLYSYRSTIYFDEYVNQGDLYIAVNTESVPYLDFGSLASYYVSSSNIVSDVSVKTVLRTLSSTSSSPTTPDSFSFGTVSITFLCFKNVPTGTIIQIVNDNPAFPGGFVGAYTTAFGDNYPLFSYGIFNSSVSILASGIVDQYKNGSISFSDAVNSIYDITYDFVSSSASPDEKTLQVLLGQTEIDNIVRLSDSEVVNALLTTAYDYFEVIFQRFRNGDLSLDSALQDMNYYYRDCLGKCDTPEQGNVINTIYNLYLNKLSADASFQSLNRLESAVSDDQLTEADDYYQSEEELIDMFEVAQFESALDFQLWFNTLPPSETIEYKKFFDYLLNDSSIRMFLVVPISLILVRILLGTHLILSRGGDHSSSSVFNRDFVSGSRYDDPFTGD